MTAREFKTRLAAGDKLAVVMHALWETEERKGRSFNMARKDSRKSYENDAAHILAALASAQRVSNAKALEGFSAEDLKELHASAGGEEMKALAYYNEHDRKAAAWLRELIAEGHIAPGEVDERSILDVRPHELTRFTQQHFFAGIGGWSLALRLAGWPDERPIRTGSCPCQPFSQAGQRKGTKDERHLWPSFRDLITFGESTVTFGEQVGGPLGLEWLTGVRADLEGRGYEVGAANLPAACVGAPHVRQRLFWMAHPQPTCEMAESDGRQPRNGDLQRSGQYGFEPQDGRSGRMGNAESERRDAGGNNGDASEWGAGPTGITSANGGMANTGHKSAWRPAGCNEAQGGWPLSESPRRGAWSDFDFIPCRDGKARRIESGSFPLAYGIPGRVGRLRGYGNAIVPQVAALFIQACKEALSQ